MQLRLLHCDYGSQMDESRFLACPRLSSGTGSE